MADIESLEDYTAHCSKCDRNRYVLYPDGDRARAKICESCFETCPACDGERYRYVRDDRGYRYAKQCPVCGTLRNRIQAFNDAHIPARYHDRRRASLELFETHDPETDQPIGNLPNIKMKLFRWVRGFEPGDQGFLLHGKVGTGKTHLLAGIVRHLTLEKGISTRFVEFTHLLSKLREQFDEGRSEAHILEPLSQVPVLAVDELGKGQNTSWQLSIIDQIVSKRYNRGLTTLATTNYPLDESSTSPPHQSGTSFTEKATRETLRERIGERIFSRLHEMTEFVEIDAPDYRKRNR
jgi:DNA replication protein DnaC